MVDHVLCRLYVWIVSFSSLARKHSDMYNQSDLFWDFFQTFNIESWKVVRGAQMQACKPNQSMVKTAQCYSVRSVWLPQDTPGYPRTPQDSIIYMFNILYERIDDGLVLVCWCINKIILSDQFGWMDGWMDGKRTDTTKHDHATDYWIKNTRILQDSRNYNI